MEVPGQLANTRRFLYNNFIYHHGRRYNGVRLRHYLCASRSTRYRCSARGWILSSGQFMPFGVHNHPRPTIQQREPVIRQLQQAAVANDDGPNEVANQVFRQNPNAANSFNQQAVAQIIHRQRRRMRPALPRTFIGLRAMLENYSNIQDSYLGCVTSSDSGLAYVFGTRNILDRLERVEEFHVDGTFQSVPQSPRASQLFIIHIRRMDVGIPALFFLCSRRTTNMYSAIWTWLLARIPLLRNNLRVVISDFEAALLASIRTSMPWVQCQGCWFHFARAVTRKWRQVRLPRQGELAPILQLTWGLPLVPSNRMDEAVNIIGSIINQQHTHNDRLFLFLRYLQRYWLPLANVVSTYGSPWRTNNISEACNRQLLSKLSGEHPPFFRFLTRVRQVLLNSDITWSRLNNGVDLGRGRRQRQRPNDLYIQNLQQNLETGRYTMREFLGGIMQRCDIQDDIILAMDRQLYEGDNFEFEDFNINDVNPPAPLLSDNDNDNHDNSDENDPDSAIEISDDDDDDADTVILGENDNPLDDDNDERDDGIVVNDEDGNDINDGANENENGDVQNHEDNGNQNENLPPQEVQNINPPVYQWVYEVLEDVDFQDVPGVTHVCCICFTNAPRVAFIPCGHRCLCFRCRSGIDLSNNARECLICRTPATDMITIFDT